MEQNVEHLRLYAGPWLRDVAGLAQPAVANPCSPWPAANLPAPKLVGGAGRRRASALATVSLLLYLLGYLALPSFRAKLADVIRDRLPALVGTQIAPVEARLDRLQVRLSGAEREIAGRAARADGGRAVAANMQAALTAVEGKLFHTQTQAALAMARIGSLAAWLEARDAMMIPVLGSSPAPSPATEPVAVVPLSAECWAPGTAPDNKVLYFSRNQEELTPAQRLEIERFAMRIKGCLGVRLSIRGFTESGPVKRNLELSRSRAGLVAEQLQQAGIPTSRMEAIGLGSASPIDNNTKPTGRDRNRRVGIRTSR